MNFGDIVEQAVNDLYNNPATANDLFTPAFIARSVNRGLRTYWRKFMDNEWGYYRFSAKTLAAGASTNVYALPNGNPGNPDTDNVAIVTAMGQLLSGTGASARWAELLPNFPTDKYKGAGQFGNWYAYLTNQGGGSGLPRWSFDKGAPDADGYPTYYIRFMPWWTSDVTINYDGVRYPTLIVIGDDGTVDDTQIADIPEHMNDCLIYRVLKDCYKRAKIDETEVMRDLQEIETDAYRVEEKSAQRQGSNLIKRTERPWGYFGSPGPSGNW